MQDRGIQYWWRNDLRHQLWQWPNSHKWSQEHAHVKNAVCNTYNKVPHAHTHTYKTLEQETPLPQITKLKYITLTLSVTTNRKRETERERTDREKRNKAAWSTIVLSLFQLHRSGVGLLCWTIPSFFPPSLLLLFISSGTRACFCSSNILRLLRLFPNQSWQKVLYHYQVCSFLCVLDFHPLLLSDSLLSLMHEIFFTWHPANLYCHKHYQILSSSFTSFVFLLSQTPPPPPAPPTLPAYGSK